MTMDAINHGVLMSESELEVSDATQRDRVLQILKGFQNIILDNPMVKNVYIEPGVDEATIILKLCISGKSFVEADRISKKMIESLSEHINNNEAKSFPPQSPRFEQMSQTLMPV